MPDDKSARKDLLIYADPGFLDDIGHYRNFADNIRAEAGRRGLELRHYVNMDVADWAVEKFSLIRAFKHKAILLEEYPAAAAGVYHGNFFSKVRGLLNRSALEKFVPPSLRETVSASEHNSRALTGFAATLESMLDDAARGGFSKIFVYMYTAHPLYFPVVAKLVNSRKYRALDLKCRLGLFYLNLDFCLGRKSPAYAHMLRLSSTALEEHDPDLRVTLLADSPRSIKLYSFYYKRPIELYPIPLAAQKRAFVKKERAGTKITVGYFGYAHPKQGYLLTKRLYMDISRMDKYSNVEFVVRHHTKFSDRQILAEAEDFKMETARVTHIPNSVERAEYDRLMDLCDVVVIPHSREDYPCQTSGSFVDCLKTGKVVIVPDDTWMSDTLREHGSGSAFKSGDYESFLKAVRGVLDDFERYREAIDRNMQSFCDFYTAETLIDKISE
jgi:glycosyltransferase involved in cell wall biosynthesis